MAGKPHKKTNADITCTDPEGCNRQVRAKGLCSIHWQRAYDQAKREERLEMSQRGMIAAMERERETRGKINLIKLPQPKPQDDDDYGLAPRFAIVNLTTAQIKVIMLALSRFTATCQKGSVAHQLLATIPTNEVF